MTVFRAGLVGIGRQVGAAWGAATLASMLLCLLGAADPAEAAESCDPDDARGTAFPRIGPLPVAETADADVETAVDIASDRAIPVLDQSRRRLSLCLDGKVAWARLSHMRRVWEAEWVVLPRALAHVARPRVRFWESQSALATYLSGADVSLAAPSYEEPLPTLTVNRLRYRGEIRLPVFSRDVIEAEIGGRQVDIASVLVPFPAAALERYAETRADLLVPKTPPIAAVLDLSGSTEGFVAPFLAALAETLAGRGGAVTVIGFGGDGWVGAPETLTLTEVAARGWRHRAGPRLAAGSHAVDTALRRAAGGGPADMSTGALILLAGGDVAPSPGLFGAFGSSVVAEVTPEIDDRLSGAIGRLSGVSFVSHSDTAPREVAARFADGLTDIPPRRPEPDDFVPAIEAFLERGQLALLPYDLESAGQLATPPAHARGAAWFAVPLWTVVNRTPLAFETEE